MGKSNNTDVPVGTKALILSKLYYGVLSKQLENLDIERYFSVLYFIYQNPRCTQQHICNQLAVDKTAMVKVMNYLIKADYIQREINPEDRREHFVVLSKKGKKQTGAIVNAFQQIDKQMFARIPKSEQKTFMKVLEKATINLGKLPSNDLFFTYNKTSSNK